MSGGFANPIVGGGGGLVYPSVHSPNFNVANPPASPSPSWAILKNGLAYFFGLVITGGTIVGPDYILSPAGLFLYNGTPALGNLAFSFSTQTGTDPVGNPFDAGLWAYNSSGGGGAALLTGTYAALYLSPPNTAHAGAAPQVQGFADFAGAANELQFAVLYSGNETSAGDNAAVQVHSESNDGTIAAMGALVITGAQVLTWDAGGVTINGSLDVNGNTATAFLILPAVSTPTAIPGNAQVFGNANATPAAETAAGLAGTLPLVQVDISTHAAGNTATAADITKAWPVPAGDGKPGTSYVIKALASVVIGATTAEALTIGVDIGGTKTALATLGGAFNGSALGAAYDIPLEMVLTVDAVSADTPQVYLSGPLGQTSANRLATNGANMSGHANTPTFTKANPNTIAIYAQWAGAGGAGQNVQTISSKFYREGP